MRYQSTGNIYQETSGIWWQDFIDNADNGQIRSFRYGIDPNQGAQATPTAMPPYSSPADPYAAPTSPYSATPNYGAPTTTNPPPVQSQPYPASPYSPTANSYSDDWNDYNQNVAPTASAFDDFVTFGPGGKLTPLLTPEVDSQGNVVRNNALNPAPTPIPHLAATHSLLVDGTNFLINTYSTGKKAWNNELTRKDAAKYALGIPGTAKTGMLWVETVFNPSSFSDVAAVPMVGMFASIAGLAQTLIQYGHVLDIQQKVCLISMLHLAAFNETGIQSPLTHIALFLIKKLAKRVRKQECAFARDTTKAILGIVAFALAASGGPIGVAIASAFALSSIIWKVGHDSIGYLISSNQADKILDCLETTLNNNRYCVNHDVNTGKLAGHIHHTANYVKQHRQCSTKLMVKNGLARLTNKGTTTTGEVEAATAAVWTIEMLKEFHDRDSQYTTQERHFAGALLDLADPEKEINLSINTNEEMFNILALKLYQKIYHCG